MPTKTNSTTQAIIDYMQYYKGAAFRVNTSGIPITKKIGKLLVIIGWRKSKNKGAADVRIIYNGYSIDAEVKTGDDIQSPDQLAFQQEVERAGGQYWLVSSSAEFIEKFEAWKKETIIHRIGNFF